jgi:hypothetical protein
VGCGGAGAFDVDFVAGGDEGAGCVGREGGSRCQPVLAADPWAWERASIEHEMACSR